MLVCAIMHTFGTRDRGCSVHPAFPAPSGLRGRQRICITRAKTRREIADAHSLRRPGERRDPYAAAGFVRKLWSTALLKQLRPVAMGPCVRRDDTEQGARTARITDAERTSLLQDCMAEIAGLLILTRAILDEQKNARGEEAWAGRSPSSGQGRLAGMSG